MKTIEIKDIAKYLDAAPIKMNVMLIGDTGIGKTQVINQYAKEKGAYLKTLVLSQLEASETLGIPVQSKRVYDGVEYNTIETAIPSWVFDLAEHKDNAILYLDEFLCAEPAVMNAFLNFLTEKRIGNIDLSSVKIIAATNIGNYTYDPDNNILSRFCMFYVVNNSYHKYLSKKYKNGISISNTYEDNEEKTGVIFEKRSLKPRCQEMLMMMTDTSLVGDFYEGYTNIAYMPIFHNHTIINGIVASFARVHEDTNSYYIDDNDIDSMAGLLYDRYLRKARKYTAKSYCTTYTNINYSAALLYKRLSDIENAANTATN